MMKSNQNKYTHSLTNYKRRKSRTVNIGVVPMGCQHPVRIQSMLNTSTMDTEASVNQGIALIKAGAEYIRLTAQNIKEAENLLKIKNKIREKGFETPIIADIHFNPKVAEKAASIVEKVRINPGNFHDKKSKNKFDYTEDEYKEELNHIRKSLLPLITICKKNNTCLRIGTNHGSLSDRIMSRYGDTPEGMVESAMEFIRICREEDFDDIVLSMKASNTRVMVYANRLLVKEMDRENMDYPLHLGVTEAGEGEDGRIKSAVGIGSLLADGIGDTIRVSLTEDPVFEIPVAGMMLDYLSKRSQSNQLEEPNDGFFDPFHYERRKTKVVGNIGGTQDPVVIADLRFEKRITTRELEMAGWYQKGKVEDWFCKERAADYIWLSEEQSIPDIPDNKRILIGYKKWKQLYSDHKWCYPVLTRDEYLNNKDKKEGIRFIHITWNALTRELLSGLNNDENSILLLESTGLNCTGEFRFVWSKLDTNDCDVPVVLYKRYGSDDAGEMQICAASDFGSMLLDGFGDGIIITNQHSVKTNVETSFGILQASRVRITQTEYISCPSCGRTNFNLEETTKRIREKTAHLKGLKIGIMGCIVNGPGEMADADYGYVGSGKGKVTLYKGKEIVKRSIKSSNAVDELIALIKENGDWAEVNDDNV